MRSPTDLLESASPLVPLDEETVALLSRPDTLARIDSLEAAMVEFRHHLGRRFRAALREALERGLERRGLAWRYVEEERVETVIGIRPITALGGPDRDFAPVLNFATSPGLPFSAPWVGIATNPRTADSYKQQVFESTRGFFGNPKQRAPASWWVQWDWCPDWPDATRTRNLAYLVGEEGERRVAAIADWILSVAPAIEEVLKPEVGDLW